MALPSGADLALLLLSGFHSMVDEVVAELELRGHVGVRPVHEFALRAIDAGADGASDLARQLDVSKQAAAKTVAALEQLGYVERLVDPDDARRKVVRVTARGRVMMSTGEALFDDVRDRWAAAIGSEQLATLHAQLAGLVGPSSASGDDVRAA